MQRYLRSAGHDSDQEQSRRRDHGEAYGAGLPALSLPGGGGLPGRRRRRAWLPGRPRRVPLPPGHAAGRSASPVRSAGHVRSAGPVRSAGRVRSAGAVRGRAGLGSVVLMGVARSLSSVCISVTASCTLAASISAASRTADACTAARRVIWPASRLAPSRISAASSATRCVMIAAWSEACRVIVAAWSSAAERILATRDTESSFAVSAAGGRSSCTRTPSRSGPRTREAPSDHLPERDRGLPHGANEFRTVKESK